MQQVKKSFKIFFFTPPSWCETFGSTINRTKVHGLTQKKKPKPKPESKTNQTQKKTQKLYQNGSKPQKTKNMENIQYERSNVNFKSDHIWIN
jgi:hypothetical protein